MDASDLFRNKEAELEYHPVIQGDNTTWYWVVLPLPSRSAAIAVGKEDSKAHASQKAHAAARNADRRITSIKLVYPVTSAPQPDFEPSDDLNAELHR